MGGYAPGPDGTCGGLSVVFFLQKCAKVVNSSGCCKILFNFVVFSGFLHCFSVSLRYGTERSWFVYVPEKFALK